MKESNPGIGCVNSNPASTRWRYIRNFIQLPIVSLMLSGCTSQWVMNRANPEAFPEARYTCETQSEEKFPVKNEVAQRSNYSNRYDTCNNRKKCGKDKSTTIIIPVTESYVMDVNKDSRNSEFYRCMSMKGWESETKWF